MGSASGGMGGASPRPAPGKEQTALLSFSAGAQIRVVLSPDLSGPLPQKWSHTPARKCRQSHHRPGAYTLPLVLLHVHHPPPPRQVSQPHSLPCLDLRVSDPWDGLLALLRVPSRVSPFGQRSLTQDKGPCQHQTHGPLKQKGPLQSPPHSLCSAER